MPVLPDVLLKIIFDFAQDRIQWFIQVATFEARNFFYHVLSPTCFDVNDDLQFDLLNPLCRKGAPDLFFEQLALFSINLNVNRSLLQHYFFLACTNANIDVAKRLHAECNVQSPEAAGMLGFALIHNFPFSVWLRENLEYSGKSLKKELKKAFLLSCRFGNSQVIDFILAQGFPLSKNTWKIALHLASFYRRPGLVKLLIDMDFGEIPTKTQTSMCKMLGVPSLDVIA